MRSPLTVRISDGVRDQQVTRFVKGLRFTKTAPGGHHSASVQIDAPEGLFADLGPADRVYIYDGRNARTVWDGYVENPGRVTVAGGARYDLSAMGGVVLASDGARAVVFIDRSLESSKWRRYTTVPSAQTGPNDNALLGEDPGIKLQFEPGTPIQNASLAGMFNDTLVMTGQPIGRLSATVTGGKASADFTPSILHAGITPFGPGALSTAPTTILVRAGVDLALPAPDSLFAFGLQYLNALGATTSDDLTWSVFQDFINMPLLQDADGDWVTPSLATYVVASSVVAHLVGSGALQVDGTGASISATTAQIDQLAYLDGAKPHQILDDLSLFEPDMLWEILESGSNGKHRFAYRAWPTTPRYEISGREFTESGGEMDLCNRIIVNWTDETGAKQTTIRTTVVPELGTRIKDAEPITLPDGQGSETNAERIGDQVLAALNTPARSGTAVVREPIQDRLTGRMAMPWEIEPGYPVRVRDKGIDLRLTEMTYEDANCTASLTLGSPTLTLAQRIAKL